MKKNFIYPIVTGAICLVLVIALVVGNVICAANYNIITAYLCGQGFNDDSEEAKAARESGIKLAQQVEEEGAVLMKNDGVLPLRNKKVNVFGWSGSDDGFMVQGSGSGTGSRDYLTTFLGGLKEAGISYNETLAKAYKDLGWKRVSGGSYVIEAHGQQYKDFYGVTEVPESFYTNDLMANAKSYSDTAIVVLGRLMGEGNDFSKTQYIAENSKQVGEDTSRKLQSLSEREEYMINLVCENFKNVVIVTNTGNPIELGLADDSRVGAVINMGMPGTRGSIGIGRILTGDVNPSGKLADTWAYDLSTAAAYATSGFEGVGRYTDLTAPYTEYRENIYTGYYWYETADKEGFWDSDFAKKTWKIKNGYKDVVQYPFGFGLSYTNFEWLVTSASLLRTAEDGTTEKIKLGKKTVIEQGDKIEIEVMVTNVGNVAGKDVVELYYSAPYKKGGIEKSAIKLGAFAKTPEIKPGEFGKVTLTMDVEEMKSYDCYDKNDNGFMGYELEQGDYTLSLRTDVHTEKAMEDGSYTLSVTDEIFYEYDTVTGEKVENQFTTYTNSKSGASSKINEPFVTKAHSLDGSENEGGEIKYLTRENFIDTFPLERGANRAAGNLKTDSYDVVTPIADPNAVAPKFNSKDTEYILDDLKGIPYDDEMWNDLVSQLTFEECCKVITVTGGNSFGTTALDKIGKKRTIDADGPCGFNNNVIGKNDLKAVNYPCDTVIAQTWNWYIAYEVGASLGIEGAALGIQGWYGPGGNLHRSAMGGRNFEYYSEDGLLAGTICAYHVLGAKKEGLLAYIKHIGANEDDKDRAAGTGAYKWLTEQAMRENYLKPFEWAVKVGKANGLMGSVTRTGGVRSTGSYAMLTAIVRNEWGFRGTVITDYYCGGTINDIDEGVRAGNTQVLHPDKSPSLFDDRTSATAKAYIFKAAKDVLFAQSDVAYYSETAPDKENTGITGTRTEISVFAWWVPVLIGVDVLSAALMGFWIFLAIRKAKMQAA